MLKWAGMAMAVALVAWPISGARALNCYETAQVNIDCSAKTGAAGSAAPANPGPSTTQLRELLQKRLATRGSTAKAPAVSAEALSKSIHDAEDRAHHALDAAAGTADPVQQDKALKAYNAAVKDLDAAYDRAAKAADSAEGRDRLIKMKAEAEQELTDDANRKFAAQRAAAEAAQAAAKGPEPDNVGMTNGYVFVCDGPLKGDHVSCHEIQPDGTYCVAVMAFDGVINWRDTATTRCSPQDLAQRAAYLARHDAAPDQAQMAARNAPGCQAMIGNYVQAAQAHDGARSQEAFEALNKAGGCGVLDQAEKNFHVEPPAGDPRFANRGDTPMTDEIFGACNQNPQACAAAIDRARAGASPEAIAKIYANAIGIGLEIGGMMGNAVLNAQAANMAHAAAANAGANAARNAPRGNAQYPRAVSCTVRGCVTTNGLGPKNNDSDITGLVR
jgi:hypothetical protein